MKKEEIYAQYAKNLKYCRQTLNLTQHEFARRSGVSRPTIGAIEEGRTFGIVIAIKISRFLEISLDDLLTKDLATDTSLF